MLSKNKGFFRVLVGTAVMAAIVMESAPSYSQLQDDIILIGESADQKEYYKAYWKTLLNLGQAQSQDQTARESAKFLQRDQESTLKDISRNLQVRNLRLAYIIKLNGSAQLTGVLTNNNPIPVTVSAVNFEILDRKGKLIQTGSAQPRPSTIAPGQSVTFSRTLLTIPTDFGYRVKLSPYPFAFGGGGGPSRKTGFFVFQ